ncbi:MAG: TIGR02530 family flagellar biosynthesis protein [Solirubrobacteraceae bacterium]
MSGIVPNPALLAPATVGSPSPANQPARSGKPATGPSFADVLVQSTASAQAPAFSKHALDRLSQRGVQLNAHTLSRLTDGLQRAAGKGSRNSVVFVDGTAFVASVQNNTVITAVTPEHMQAHVFTNIDSAVIA